MTQGITETLPPTQNASLPDVLPPNTPPDAPTAQELKIIELRMLGFSYRRIARKANISLNIVRRVLTNIKIKTYLDSVKDSIMRRALHHGANLTVSLIKRGSKVSQYIDTMNIEEQGKAASEYKDLIQQAQRAWKPLQESTGITASPTQPYFLQQVNIDARQGAQSSETQEFLRSLLVKKVELDSGKTRKVDNSGANGEVINV